VHFATYDQKQAFKRFARNLSFYYVKKIKQTEKKR